MLIVFLSWGGWQKYNSKLGNVVITHQPNKPYAKYASMYNGIDTNAYFEMLVRKFLCNLIDIKV
jgi:hypothetical protein